MIKRNGFLLPERVIAFGQRSVKNSTESEKLLPRSDSPDVGQCERRRLHMDDHIRKQNIATAGVDGPNGVSPASLGLILLPTMFYHPFQLFVRGLLANRFAAGAEVVRQMPVRSVALEAGRAPRRPAGPLGA
jgi:hypothetical protein